jgi:hypothetical protein
MPAPAEELNKFLDRYITGMEPWATGTRFLSFAERTSSIRTCVPESALQRLELARLDSDPERVLVASHRVD